MVRLRNRLAKALEVIQNHSVSAHKVTGTATVALRQDRMTLQPAGPGNSDPLLECPTCNTFAASG